MHSFLRVALSGLVATLMIATWSAGQDPTEPEIESTEQESVRAIIIETDPKQRKLPVIFSGKADATVQLSTKRATQKIRLTGKVIQGDAKIVSFGLGGSGDVLEVKGKGIVAWSVRQADKTRFLDLHLGKGVTKFQPVITLQSQTYSLPAELELTHLRSGDAIGFSTKLTIEPQAGVDSKIVDASGFLSIQDQERTFRLQSTSGGRIALMLRRSGGARPDIEVTQTSLNGKLDDHGTSMDFQYRGVANVTQPNAEMVILSGDAAISHERTDPNYRLKLATMDGIGVYKLVFPNAGTFPIELDFAAKLTSPDANQKGLRFCVAGGAVVPIVLSGLPSDAEFQRDSQTVVPMREKDTWKGFLPASGKANLLWRIARKSREGKLFFSTTSQIETRIGAGLLRQDHQITYQVLQGELESIRIQLDGPGEILDVQGDNVISWKVVSEDTSRRLEIGLSQPLTSSLQIHVRSQTPLGAFPVQTDCLRLTPEGAIRNSGYLRLSNIGSVRLEPTNVAGLTQLAPNQFPGKALEARQIFLYRFPTAEYEFAVVADRVQPEVNISQLALYRLGETERVINAEIELDIREAPIREWDFEIPSDYSVVSVTGSSVADYIVANEESNGKRNLRVLFANDLSGRQLISLYLEKSESAAEADWELPQIQFPGVKSVRGDIGIVSTPGFRVSVGETNSLTEKPLSYFPRPTPGLQQAFRIRQADWTATMSIETLQRSIQSDVFHLYSLSQETVYASVLINYFVTGAPVSEWRVTVPQTLGNVMVDGKDVRTWRQEDDTLIVSLHQPVMGAFTLLITYEQKPADSSGEFSAGIVTPIDVQSERGYVHVVSPIQVEVATESVSSNLLQLDPLELPAEFRLLSTAPPLETWQYTERPFDLDFRVNWFQPGNTAAQIIEFSEANSRVSKDGELVTDVVYYVKTRGRQVFRLQLPPSPVRLWDVAVDGVPVTARETEDATLIPLPGSDPNAPIEVKLRLGKPAVDESNPELALPVVMAPVLKTQWNVSGDEQHVLVPHGGSVDSFQPVLRPNGFSRVTTNGLIYLAAISLLVAFGAWGIQRNTGIRIVAFLGLLSALVICGFAFLSSWLHAQPPRPLELSLPILAAGETIELNVKNMSLWRADVSVMGIVISAFGILGLVASYFFTNPHQVKVTRCLSVILVLIGVLCHSNGAPWFFAAIGLLIIALLFTRPAWETCIEMRRRWLRAKQEAEQSVTPTSDHDSGAGAATTALLLFAVAAFSLNTCVANDSLDFVAADSITQTWEIDRQSTRLVASGELKLSGRPGDRMILLKAPAVLTNFNGKGLRVSKEPIDGIGLTYVVGIPIDEEDPQDTESDEPASDSKKGNSSPVTEFSASFDYQIESTNSISGIPVLTGAAAFQQADIQFDEPGWDILCSKAVRVDLLESEKQTRAKVLLGIGDASVVVKPKARDVTTEETQFFVEGTNLFIPGPGVVDGLHRLSVRTSQGQINELNINVPDGFAVSSVEGPIGAWQFDADESVLKIVIEPAQSRTFHLQIETQRGLSTLPADVAVTPLTVDQAGGQVGLVAVAFGPDAQPEKIDAEKMSAVNLGDFDSHLLKDRAAVLHRVYRYGADGGALSIRVSPVQPEVRLMSNQVLSLGDERAILAINFAAEITRAGLFQLSFPLPKGFEVESLTGDSLHHWTELGEEDDRKIIMHLNGKTIGAQSFALSLAGNAPAEVGDWAIPRFELDEASRQTGELVIRPTTGLRLRTVSRQNVSEIDPRAVGGEGRGALAFRLLQRDWNLTLGIDRLEPWITGQVLHEMMLREGQTQTTVIGNFDVQNASVRALTVVLPLFDDQVIKTVRASGDVVSDFVRSASDSNVWEIQFKRRVIGRVQFQIEYERRGDRVSDTESLNPVGFPQSKQLSYFFGIRAGGRLEVEHDPLTQGWQSTDWSAVPQPLRDAGNRYTPAMVIRAVTPSGALAIRAKRHSLADALKLRVAKGMLTTVLSPAGDQLTAVDVTLEVIQRSNLVVGLPIGGDVLSIFVNGESVNSIRLKEDENVWQFYVLPGIDDRTATVQFVYSLTGNRLKNLQLESPRMNVPLENIEWNVIAPRGFELTDNDGNLELIRETNRGGESRREYLSKVVGSRENQAKQAAALLQRANQLLQQGEQSKANWALNSVANQYALDAASNEDARIQLENLQTQQAVVGLNTRLQRLYLSNSSKGTFLKNDQIRQAAADNPILRENQLNFRPEQLSQLLQGNSSEDNEVLQRIAARLVRHQRTTDPAPQAILISMPEDGTAYSFGRTVQVAENRPLQLNLDFEPKQRISAWKIAVLLALVTAVGASLMLTPTANRDDSNTDSVNG